MDVHFPLKVETHWMLDVLCREKNWAEFGFLPTSSGVRHRRPAPPKLRFTRELLSLCLALGTLILLRFHPFLPRSCFPLFSGAVRILSSLCGAPITSSPHTISQLQNTVLLAAPNIKFLALLLNESYCRNLMWEGTKSSLTLLREEWMRATQVRVDKRAGTTPCRNSQALLRSLDLPQKQMEATEWF